MMTMLRTLLPTLALGWIPLIALAALPPQYAAERELGLLEGAVEARKKANTVAELTVRSVSKKARNDGECWQSVTYTVTGTVDAVTRAPKALDPGSKLTFSYTTQQYRDDTGCAGPQVWYDVVRKGDRLHAHLTCDENDACTAVAPYGALRSDAALESAIASVREEADSYAVEPEEPPPPPEPPPLPEPEAWVRQCLNDAPPATAVKDCKNRWANLCQDRPQGGTTVGITGCIASELKVWETLLAEVHVKLDAAAKSYDEYTPEGYSVQRSLNASKEAWQAFREAQCDYEYTEYIEGTMRGIVGVGCQLSLTTQRYEYLLSHGRQQNHFE